jgi:hypothetical protein
VITVPTTGDIGLTWDEPAYRFSQLRSEAWWARLAHARSRQELSDLVDPDALLYYWTYARHGINFHPPLAGQLNLLTYELFGGWMKDIPARRMSSVFEFALTITIGYAFLARRYGRWAGVVMAGSLLFMPRVYGHAHIAGTDTPGLLLWAATALAFWKGLYEPGAGGWRVLVGVLLGLAFVEKMAAVFVLAPLLLWLLVARLPATFARGGRADWIDGLVTGVPMLSALGVAFAEILRLARLFPPPLYTDMFIKRPRSVLPGAVLALPLLVWVIRRLSGKVWPRSPIWGAERPALELATSVLAFAPVVGWLGNPTWWRETLPRLAHYYLINTDRRGSLPDIQILYFGQAYEYSLPWHNAWVLLAITVPATVLAAALIGLTFTLGHVRRDRLPLYFGLHLITLPIFRMFPTPAHDGVRLFLPTFFFLAAFSGWGAIGLADGLTRLLRARRVWPARVVVAACVLGPASWQLIKTHPYELSYYNELVGGPRGAWKAGFELSYWYDAFNPSALAEINARLPSGAVIDFFNDKTKPPTFVELQSLGQVRSDIRFGWPREDRDLDAFPYVWLLTQDSKASAFTRLLFAMEPRFYASRPQQLDGLQVAAVADPVAVARAYALALLLDSADDRPHDRRRTPAWVHNLAPFLGRLWGEGLTKVSPLGVNRRVVDWARRDPGGLVAAARLVAEQRTPGTDPASQRLWRELTRIRAYPFYAEWLLRARPEALVEAVEILNARPEAVIAVMTRYGYTDPATIGGCLDQDLAQ